MKRFAALALALCLMAVCAASALADGSWTCPTCGKENTGNFCMDCGTPRPAETVCPSCGEHLTGTYRFCPNCGADLTAAAAPAAAEPSVVQASVNMLRCGVSYDRPADGLPGFYSQQFMGCVVDTAAMPAGVDKYIAIYLKATKGHELADCTVTLVFPDGSKTTFTDVDLKDSSTTLLTSYRGTASSDVQQGTYRVLVNDEEVRRFTVSFLGDRDTGTAAPVVGSFTVEYGGVQYEITKDESRLVDSVNYVSAAELGYGRYMISACLHAAADGTGKHAIRIVREGDGEEIFATSAGHEFEEERNTTYTFSSTVDKDKLPGWYRVYLDGEPVYRFPVVVEGVEASAAAPSGDTLDTDTALRLGRIAHVSALGMTVDVPALASPAGGSAAEWIARDDYTKEAPAARIIRLSAAQTEQMKTATGGELTAAGLASYLNKTVDADYAAAADGLAVGPVFLDRGAAWGEGPAWLVLSYYDSNLVVTLVNDGMDAWSAALVKSDRTVFGQTDLKAIKRYAAGMNITGDIVMYTLDGNASTPLMPDR